MWGFESSLGKSSVIGSYSIDYPERFAFGETRFYEFLLITKIRT
ncbi:MAG: hypothetical protein PHT01_02330 [Spirochaetales bacterium]|nr:hypothetical protein [Spirochaetales bacterium]